MRALWIASCLLAAASAGAADGRMGSPAAGPRNLRPAAFTEEQIDALVGTGSGGRAPGAETKTQLFYHFFKPDRDPGLVAPAWLNASLPDMIRRPAWQDPDEGVLNEAQLWQAPPSVLFEFFELVRKTLPKERGGASSSPPFQFRQLEDDCVRYAQSVDRLRRARLGKSLGGRGRAVIADFQRIVPEMNRARDAAISCDEGRYIAAVMSVAALSDAALHDLQ